MRSLFAIGVTMVIGCGMAVPDQSIPAGSEAGSAAAYRVLKAGSYGMAASEIPSDKIPPPAIVVANDAQAYGAQWNRLIGAEVPPRVDFSRESVVFLLLGNRSSGGYSIEPAAVEVSGGSATVIADVKSPERDSVSTMAITAPFAVLAIDKPGIGNADWVGSDRKQVARSER